MESLLEQIFERWTQVFDELNDISYYKGLAKTTLYADGSRYNMEKFDRNYFPSDGSLTKDKRA
jgi:hypothetical protein